MLKRAKQVKQAKLLVCIVLSLFRHCIKILVVCVRYGSGMFGGRD